MFLGILRLTLQHAPVAVVIPPRFRGKIRHYTGSLFCLGLLWVQPCGAQTPQITGQGVVNAGSYAQPISPGSIVSIFGTNLASTTATARETPLPTVLVGTSVTLNGVKAPLFYVSPRQINLQAPWELQSALDPSGSEFGSATVVVTMLSGSSAPAQAPIYDSGPAIFSLDASGCGRALALNVAPNGSVSLNSPSNSAAPGDYVNIYGTGFGLVYFPPADGSASPETQNLEGGEGILLDGQLLPGYSYAGLAPGLAGVEQTNFQIPSGTREGCAVPVAVGISPALSISIHSGRGQCVDPPIQSYGQVSLTKTIASGTGNDGETDTLTAVFPSGPGLKPQATSTPPVGTVASYPPVPVSRSCPVDGYADLSAGMMQVQAINTGTSVTATPNSQTGGVVYQQALPAGFIGPGPYTISASGNPVTFKAGLNVDSPIQIQTPFPPGAAISSSQGLTVKWDRRHSRISGEGDHYLGPWVQ